MKYHSFFFLFSFLTNVAVSNAQTFTFQNRKSSSTSTIQVGQQVKLFVFDTNDKLLNYSGKLKNVTSDSLFIQQKQKTIGFAMANINEIVAKSNAQIFTFQNQKNSSTSTIQVGQRIKLFVYDSNQRLLQFSGKLANITSDSLFIQQKQKTKGFAMANVNEIRFRSTAMESFTRFFRFAGLALIGVAVLIVGIFFIPAMGSSSANSTVNAMPPVLAAGVVLVLISLISGVASQQWIYKPATSWTWEVQDKDLKEVP